nr:glycosyltransferase family 2 protein [uncultured Cupriavidus sp.]
MPLSSGVAMCTCNAGVFLQAQLESIANQTVLPTQVVVSDDRSDDGTWEQLVAWAERVHAQQLFRVSLMRNDNRLGVTKNFEQAIGALTTDLIFLADQDDIWVNTKVASMVGIFTANERALLVHSDARLIDEHDADLRKSLFEALRLSHHEWELARQKRFFEIYCRRNLVTGTTAAFRSSLLNLASPFPADWIHDEWLAMCAAIAGEVVMLDTKLTDYRQHNTNVIGVPLTQLSRIAKYAMKVAKSPRDEHLEYKIRRLDALLGRLRGLGRVEHEKVALLEEARGHFARRLNFGRSIFQRIACVVHESRSQGYRRFADGFAGMVRDLIHL